MVKKKQHKICRDVTPHCCVDHAPYQCIRAYEVDKHRALDRHLASEALLPASHVEN